MIERNQILNWENLIEQTEHRCEATQLELHYNRQHNNFSTEEDIR